MNLKAHNQACVVTHSRALMQINRVMKLFLKLFTCTLFIFSTTTFSASAIEPDPDKASTASVTEFDTYTSEVETELQRNSILAFAHKFRGVPYRYGASSPRGFDCSGFTSYVFKNFGYKLARRASHQVTNGERVSRDELQPGDLVFFGGRGNGPRIGHVGIVTDVDDNGKDFSFIHASTHKGITVNHSTDSYYRVRYRGACRIIKCID